MKPWTIKALTLLPDTELVEAFCDGHDQTMTHRSGRTGARTSESATALEYLWTWGLLIVDSLLIDDFGLVIDIGGNNRPRNR